MSNYSENIRRLSAILSICFIAISILTIVMLAKYKNLELENAIEIDCGYNRQGCSNTAYATIAFVVGVIVMYFFTARLLWFIACDIKIGIICGNDDCSQSMFIFVVNIIIWTYSLLTCFIAWGMNANAGRYIPTTPLQWFAFLHSVIILGSIALTISAGVLYLIAIFLRLIFSGLFPDSLKELFKCSCNVNCYKQKRKWIDAKCRLCDIELTNGIDILECDHAFHNKCISGKNNCPTCNV